MKNELKIFLASPRGFCAGVERAIDIVNKTLDKLVVHICIVEPHL